MEQFIIRHCPRSWRSTNNFKKQNPSLYRKKFIISISQHLISPFKVHRAYSYIYTKNIQLAVILLLFSFQVFFLSHSHYKFLKCRTTDSFDLSQHPV